jgi:hypothetical protein
VSRTARHPARSAEGSGETGRIYALLLDLSPAAPIAPSTYVHRASQTLKETNRDRDFIGVAQIFGGTDGKNAWCDVRPGEVHILSSRSPTKVERDNAAALNMHVYGINVVVLPNARSWFSRSSDPVLPDEYAGLVGRNVKYFYLANGEIRTELGTVGALVHSHELAERDWVFSWPFNGSLWAHANDKAAERGWFSRLLSCQPPTYGQDQPSEKSFWQKLDFP